MQTTNKKMRNQHQFIARCLRGIEWILAAEIEATGAQVLGVEHRQVQFMMSGPTVDRLNLHSADDVFLYVGVLENIPHTRDALGAIQEGVSEFNWNDAVQNLWRIHQSSNGKESRTGTFEYWDKFTVVASFLGKRNYNRFEIQRTLAQGVDSQLDFKYLEKIDSETQSQTLTIRIHIANEQAKLFIRVFVRPLHRREYKQHSVTGTLHPPLAYAMCLLAGLNENMRVLDPFCGVGTIPIELKRQFPSLNVFGSDIDSDRLTMAKLNAENANVEIEFEHVDAVEVTADTDKFDRVVCNPPWGLAVEKRGGYQSSGMADFLSTLKRITKTNSRIVMLVDDTLDINDQMLESSGFELKSKQSVSVFGQQPLLVVLTRSENSTDPIDAGSILGEQLLKTHRYVHELSS